MKKWEENATLLSILKACAKTKDLCKGSRVHDHIRNRGLLDKNRHLGSSLVNMYAKCGDLSRAENMLDELQVRDVISWNALISGYVQHGHGQEAILCFERMRSEGISPVGVTFSCILKACGSVGDLDKGKEIHDAILREDLLAEDPVLGTALVHMYAKCGALAKAQEVFEGLHLRNVVSWSALIAGYALRGHGHEALTCFQQMRNEGISATTATFVCALKACACIQDIGKGEEIHDEIVSRRLLKDDVVLGNALLDMYAKCGALVEARQVLDKLPFRNVVSWNTLIAGYAQQDRWHEALDCYDRMQREGFCPDIATFVCILKACGEAGELYKGKDIHRKIAREGSSEKNIDLGTALVDMYVKCGDLPKALEVLEGLPIRDLVAWNVLVSGYAQAGRFCEVLNCFEQIRNEGLPPDEFTFLSVLKAAGRSGAVERVKQIHDEIVDGGFLNSVLGNALVDMYAKCGALVEARNMLEDLPIRDVVSWSSLIAGCVQAGRAHEALDFFGRMQDDGLSPDCVTFISILRACSMTMDSDKGEQIHKEVVGRGLLEKDTGLGISLVEMYAKCGLFAKARGVIDALPAQSGASWSALIAGYAASGKCCEAVKCYERLQAEGLLALEAAAFASILKSCGSSGAVEMGKQIHIKISHGGLLEKSSVLGTALVDMYVKCGMLSEAQQVLDDLPIRDAISWNALMAGYAQQELCDKALVCYDRMQSEGLSPDAVSFVCLLKACSSAKTIRKGDQIFKEISSRGLQNDVVVATALVDMYAKCGAFRKAQKVLNELHVRDAISWNALIAGYVQQGKHREALDCFDGMRSEGIRADEVTFGCILKACGSIGLIEKGKQIHGDIVRREMLRSDILLSTALIDMYARCGMLDRAQQLLATLPIKDVLPWNAFIAGCSRQGQGHKALYAYKRMRIEGLSPDQVTFLSVLSACSHSGLLDEAQMVFGDMVAKYGTTPSFKHHSSMVMAFGFSGHFDKAVSVIRAMPSSDCCEIWLALLCVCKKWGNAKLARLAFDQIVRLEDRCGAAYVLMAEIFVGIGMQQDAESIESMRMKYAAA